MLITLITSCESTETPGDLRPLGQHTFIDSVRVLGTAAGAWECFNQLLNVTLSLYNVQVPSPSYSALSFFANQETGIMLVASPPLCIMASASSSVSEEGLPSLPCLEDKMWTSRGDLSASKVEGAYLCELDSPLPPCSPFTTI